MALPTLQDLIDEVVISLDELQVVLGERLEQLRIRLARLWEVIRARLQQHLQPAVKAEGIKQATYQLAECSIFFKMNPSYKSIQQSKLFLIDRASSPLRI